jgi:phosphatidylglycerol:prolipoprotein diacylglycerol transferase
MLPVLQLGPLAIRLPGLFLIAGVWLATMLVEKVSPRQGLPGDALNSMIFYSLVAGVVGARLGYVLHFPDVYLADPLVVFSLNTFTLSPTEGLLAGGITALVYGRRRGLPFWRALDALTPSLAVMAIAIALAHVSSGDAFGSPSDLPWAVELWGARRHPTQVFELLAACLLFAYAWKGRERPPIPGYAFLTWATMTALGRVFLEAFRGDSQVVFGELRIAQLAALLLVMAGLWALHLRALAARAAED